MMDENKNEGVACSLVVLVILALLLCIVMFSSCKTRYITNTEYKYKEVPVQVHDTLFKTAYKYDTTYVKDSIFIHQKGDTIFRDRWRTQYKLQIAKDTVNKYVEIPYAVHDSVMVDNTVVKVEYRTRWWQSALDWGFGIALVIGALYFGIKRKWLSKFFS